MKINFRHNLMHASRLVFLGILAVTVMSCTGNFEKYNTNQYEADEEMINKDDLNIGGYLMQMQRDVIPTTDVTANQYQRAVSLISDIYSGFFTAIGVWNGGVHNVTYNLYFDNWNNVAFEVAFNNVMSSWLNLKRNAEKNNRMAPYAMGQIVKVLAMHRITDIYGPLPYLGFGESGLNTPYTSQKDIYLSFFDDLDAAIADLEEYNSNNPGVALMQKFDMYYAGDVTKWLKLANTLKLRLAMRISDVEPVLAKRLAEEAVAGGVMETNADNAVLKTYRGIIVQNPAQTVWDSYGESRMNANMESYLRGYKDPRTPHYFQSYTWIDDDPMPYHGARHGIAITSKTNYEKLSKPNIYSNTSEYPVKIMTAAESHFLRAEGAIRNWNMGGQAKDFYESGVTVSFGEWGVTLGNYLSRYTDYKQDGVTIDWDYKPANFTAASGTTGTINAMSTIRIPWVDTDGFNTKLERIITQKWIALYPESMEAWSEYRRTGFPKLFPVVTNNSGGTIDTNIQIRRIVFPKSEYQRNAAQVAAAVAMIGGRDTGGVRLWWDVE